MVRLNDDGAVGPPFNLDPLFGCAVVRRPEPRRIGDLAEVLPRATVECRGFGGGRSGERLGQAREEADPQFRDPGQVWSSDQLGVGNPGRLAELFWCEGATEVVDRVAVGLGVVRIAVPGLCPDRDPLAVAQQG